MHKVTLKIKDIIPIDHPRRDTMQFIQPLWEHEGPPEKCIDLTHLDIKIMQLSDGRYCGVNGHNRLWYLASRCGIDQEVQVNCFQQSEILEVFRNWGEDEAKMYFELIESRIKEHNERGIQTFGDIDKITDEEWDEPSQEFDPIDYSPFK